MKARELARTRPPAPSGKSPVAHAAPWTAAACCRFAEGAACCVRRGASAPTAPRRGPQRHPVLDQTSRATYPHVRLKFLRSKILIVIASVFILTGYAHAVIDRCCDEKQTERAGHGKSAPVEDDGCQCLCHKVFSNVSPTPVRLPVLTLILQTVRWPEGEFPPDAVPLGIDYPPQLA